MIVWTPALTQTLITIVGFVTVSIVALGQWQVYRQRGWRDAAEARDAIIDNLTRQLDEATKEREVLTVRMEALEAQVAEVQRMNHRLQIALDKAETRHAAIDARTEARNLAQHPRAE